MRPVLFPAIVAASLAACTQFPELDGTIAPAMADAPPPALVPLAPLVAQASNAQTQTTAIQTTNAGLTPRLASLRARAARLRGPVIPAGPRARMIRAIRAAR